VFHITKFRPGFVRLRPSEFFLAVHERDTSTSLREVALFVDSRSITEVLLGALTRKPCIALCTNRKRTVRKRRQNYGSSSTVPVAHARFYRVPGRLILIEEHTDCNDGLIIDLELLQNQRGGYATRFSEV
jgi:hypothetical protein